jgi:hypothetical protein
LGGGGAFITAVPYGAGGVEASLPLLQHPTVQLGDRAMLWPPRRGRSAEPTSRAWLVHPYPSAQLMLAVEAPILMPNLA